MADSHGHVAAPKETQARAAVTMSRTAKMTTQFGKFRKRVTDMQNMHARMLTECDQRPQSGETQGTGGVDGAEKRKQLVALVSALEALSQTAGSRGVTIEPGGPHAETLERCVGVLRRFLENQHTMQQDSQELMGTVLKFATGVLPVLG